MEPNILDIQPWGVQFITRLLGQLLDVEEKKEPFMKNNVESGHTDGSYSHECHPSSRSADRDHSSMTMDDQFIVNNRISLSQHPYDPYEQDETYDDIPITNYNYEDEYIHYHYTVDDLAQQPGSVLETRTQSAPRAIENVPEHYSNKRSAEDEEFDRMRYDIATHRMYHRIAAARHYHYHRQHDHHHQQQQKYHPLEK